MGIHIKGHQTLKNTERTIKNGQSRDTEMSKQLGWASLKTKCIIDIEV
jgi:hypothetical protein